MLKRRGGDRWFVDGGYRPQRLKQIFTRLDGDRCFAHTSTSFDFACELSYDASGLIVDHPAIAQRVT